MKFLKTKIQGCYLIHPEVLKDSRGGFFRTFCEDEFKRETGQNIIFKQLNHSINTSKGTFRGMHYQSSPYGEEKLVRCIQGTVIDYFVDLRKNSPTFLQYDQVELSAINKNMIYLCKGIAHGFLTLEVNTELIYHHTESYQKDADRGLKYSDKKINIKLPFDPLVISEKDDNYPTLPINFKGI